MNIIHQASQLVHSSAPPFYYLIVTIGFITIVDLLVVLGRAICKRFARKRIVLNKRYGQNSWALITGSSQGIGREFAFKLAEEGFNVILLARTLFRLQSVKSQIEERFPHVKVEIIVADLIEEGRKQNIDDVLAELKRFQDISVVVNNAGINSVDMYHNVKVSHIFDLISVDCFALAALNYKFMKVFQSRKSKQDKRSCIINVGSLAGLSPFAIINFYSSSKRYVDLLTKNLALEYSDIDWLVLNPVFVATRMVNFNRSLLCATTQQSVDGTFSSLGYETATGGDPIHSFLNYISCQIMNSRFVNFIFVRLLTMTSEKRLLPQGNGETS